MAKRTAKQLEYIRLRGIGKTQYMAYKGSYDTEDMKTQTIRNKASDLEKELKTDIDELLAEVLRRSTESSIADVNEVLEFYTQMMRGDIPQKATFKIIKETSRIDKKTQKILRTKKEHLEEVEIAASNTSRLEGAKGLERVLVGSKLVIEDERSKIDLSKITPETLEELEKHLETLEDD